MVGQVAQFTGERGEVEQEKAGAGKSFSASCSLKLVSFEHPSLRNLGVFLVFMVTKAV